MSHRPVAVPERFERAVRCVLALQMRRPVSARWLMDEFGLSRAQAKRDLVELERLLPVKKERREVRVVLVLA